MEKQKNSIAAYFSLIRDPRANISTHKLLDIFTITIIAVICGCEDWEEIVLYGQCREEFLKCFLDLPNGIPSHDTFERVFKRIEPTEFEKCFRDWANSLCMGKLEGLVNIDGKTLRGSGTKSKSKSAIHMVSAWSNENQLVLGQLKVDSKTNEIKAIPILIDLLDIQGCTVTIDAMGCQKEIADKIIDSGADYILALKGNQKELYEEIENAFSQCPSTSNDKTVEKDHGRIETRECAVIQDMDWVYEKDNWKGLKSIIKVNSKRELKDRVETQTRYYISSLNLHASEANKFVRYHWGIENSLHWVLDVTFREDDSRVRTGNSSENLSIIRTIALNIIKADKTTKLSMKKKRLKASLDDHYLIHLLNHD